MEPVVPGRIERTCHRISERRVRCNVAVGETVGHGEVNDRVAGVVDLAERGQREAKFPTHQESEKPPHHAGKTAFV